jgi:hypothetical protein
MENRENLSEEIGNFVRDNISVVICSFDELIKSKNDHDKDVYQVIKNEILDIRIKAGEKLIDDCFDAKFSLEEKDKLKNDYKQACDKIIKHNLKEKAL